MSCYGRILTICLILSFIFMANGFSILLGLVQYNCFYHQLHHAKLLTSTIILLSSTTCFVIAWVILMMKLKHIKMGCVYTMLLWIGLFYVLTSEFWKWKSYRALACIGLGLFITICYCFLILFRLLKLAVRQKPVQLCKGGNMVVKIVLVCIVNGDVMVGKRVLLIQSDCKPLLALAMLMLTTGFIGFALFCCLYDLEKEQEEVLPSPPPATGASLEFREPGHLQLIRLETLKVKTITSLRYADAHDFDSHTSDISTVF